MAIRSGVEEKVYDDQPGEERVLSQVLFTTILHQKRLTNVSAEASASVNFR